MDWIKQALDLLAKGQRFYVEVSQGKEQNFAELYLTSLNIKYTSEESNNKVVFKQKGGFQNG